jgi:hypothetical protein
VLRYSGNQRPPSDVNIGLGAEGTSSLYTKWLCSGWTSRHRNMVQGFKGSPAFTSNSVFFAKTVARFDRFLLRTTTSTFVAISQWEVMTVRCLWPETECIGWSVSVRNVGELILMCETECNVFCRLRRVVGVCDCRLVTNWTRNKWPSVKSDRDVCFWHDLYVFPRRSLGVFRDSCVGQMHSLE